MAAWRDPLTDEDEDEGPVLAHSPVKDDSELDITPMIDITFLLLIFFLVAAQRDPSSVELPSARYGSLAGVYSSIVVTLADDGTGKALVYRGDGAGDDTRLVRGDADAQQQELGEWVGQELLQGNKTGVLIKAARGVRHGDVARISRICVEAGGGEGANRLPLHMAVLETD
jgi:biopolymer transport protein ExbD